MVSSNRIKKRTQPAKSAENRLFFAVKQFKILLIHIYPDKKFIVHIKNLKILGIKKSAKKADLLL